MAFPVLDILAWCIKNINFKEKKKILVVEDDATAGLLMSACLTHCKKDFTLVETAEAAMALVKRNKIGLIFIDMRLQFMNGWDLIPLVAQCSPDSLIVATCTCLEDLARIPYPQPVFACLVKPISVEKLQKILTIAKL